MYGGGPAHTGRLRLQLGLQSCLLTLGENLLFVPTYFLKKQLIAVCHILFYFTLPPDGPNSSSASRFTTHNVTLKRLVVVTITLEPRLDPICKQDRWAELDQFHVDHQVTVRGRRGSKPGTGPKQANKSNWAQVNSQIRSNHRE